MRHLQLGGHKPGHAIRGWAFVDDDDYEYACRWRWSLIDGYATRMDAKSRRLVVLHRALLGLIPGDARQVDHINRNRLDNRRSNLRVVTHAQNCQNIPSRRGSASRFRGVRRARARWQAYGHVSGVFHHLGVFDTEEEAAQAALAFRMQAMPFATDTVI